MYEQSTKSEIAAQEEQLETAKKRLNKNQETKARAEGEIETVKAALADSNKYLKDTQQECMERASEFEAESAERSDELKTLAEAKKILTADGVDKAEGRLSEIQGSKPRPLSFLQIQAATTVLNPFPERQLAAASYLRREGERIQSYILAQVGNRLAADPFAKVKDMIQAMVEKLLQEQAEESEHKAWCDKETSKTGESLDLKSDRVDELATRLDKAKAESAELAREVQVLYEEIQQLDQGVKEATAMRQKEAADFAERKKDYEQGQTACAGWPSRTSRGCSRRRRPRRTRPSASLTPSPRTPRLAALPRKPSRRTRLPNASACRGRSRRRGRTTATRRRSSRRRR